MDIAPTARDIVRPDLLDYSDTTEHAFMCQYLTLCQILINPIPFYSESAQENKKHKKPPAAKIPCLTSHHTIHSICSCSHP